MVQIDGCKCYKCGKWHSHIKRLRNGKYVCVNCFYEENGEEEENGR